jgi:hypothetical protein
LALGANTGQHNSTQKLLVGLITQDAPLFVSLRCGFGRGEERRGERRGALGKGSLRRAAPYFK